MIASACAQSIGSPGVGTLQHFAGEVFRLRLRARLRHLRVLDELLHAGALHEVPAAVLHEEGGDVLVALQVLAFE